MLVLVRVQCLGLLEVAVARAYGPVWRRIDREPNPVGVERVEVEVVPILVRLPAVEQRAFELHVLGEHSGREHSIGDVGGVGPVVGQRREGIVQGRRPVHVGHGADPRLADGRDVHHDARRDGRSAARTARTAP